ncbi:hypothetical protein [Sorangium cellulosum]|uniref:Uncharacterized protein n=1 Tax=Sorangium cellulosum So0157-2 TaxID=1254432 RepID=S4XYV6_SORCE|nr:hypothetical protein [Sorangium cellulosum]AGP37496.1 hypothetical protein SCE1572_25200 [Sorangium cellulosum So0157-2]
MDLCVSLESPDHGQLLNALSQHKWFRSPPGEAPSDAEVGAKRGVAVPAQWQTLYDGDAHVTFHWRDAQQRSQRMLSVEPEIVAVIVQPERLSVEVFLEEMSSLPFEIAAVAPVHPWRVPGKPREGYVPPAFGGGHYELGPLCVFKGAGHRRLSSSRWLDFGPWRVVRDAATDTTLVQFHEEDVDAKTAMAQAKPGHQRMADPEVGGFMPHLFRVKSELKFFYHRAQRRMSVICAEGGDVTPRQMRDACIVRFHNHVDPARFAAYRENLKRTSQKFGPQQGEAARFPADEPFDNIAFVFVTDVDAQRHLHELWLRGLECWSMEGGGLRRLDDAYHPEPPAKPEWVARAERGTGRAP